MLRASKEYNYDLEYTFTVSEDCTFTVAMEPTPIMKGDINFDGKVNPIDANLMVRIVLGTDETDYRSFSAADVNCDGKVNSLDANLILQMVLGG